MSSLFCCDSVKPYRPQYLLHQQKFTSFMDWASYPREPAPSGGEHDQASFAELDPPFAVQLVRQVNYGPLETKRYFIPVKDSPEENAFVEVAEQDLIQANFQKLNSYKNYKCDAHNKFFEVNLYEKDPVNKHHWRVNLARPSTSIDL
ncbi:hypothetical protein NKR19_g5963 [Coniochaeta hoffmannii]|uniref:Uncharacterized protein n=1 Tax=Coniochaeta hoffmannii TaxID=91930 RepID=A0AA38RGG8_9PEZI|nr:hypothetical protein NKR19_g5963 [Coniochaeta hoffmannii]